MAYAANAADVCSSRRVCPYLQGLLPQYPRRPQENCLGKVWLIKVPRSSTCPGFARARVTSSCQGLCLRERGGGSARSCSPSRGALGGGHGLRMQPLDVRQLRPLPCDAVSRSCGDEGSQTGPWEPGRSLRAVQVRGGEGRFGSRRRSRSGPAPGGQSGAALGPKAGLPLRPPAAQKGQD